MASNAINDDIVGALDPRLGAGQCLAVRRLSLTDFRCYDFVRLETDERPVVLTGPNGAGKTNLLEAISFLTPGRGLRRAKLSDVGRAPIGNAWAVAAKLDRGGESFDIGTGCRNDDNNGGRDKRGSAVARSHRYHTANAIHPVLRCGNPVNENRPCDAENPGYRCAEIASESLEP